MTGGWNLLCTQACQLSAHHKQADFLVTTGGAFSELRRGVLCLPAAQQSAVPGLLARQLSAGSCHQPTGCILCVASVSAADANLALSSLTDNVPGLQACQGSACP